MFPLIATFVLAAQNGPASAPTLPPPGKVAITVNGHPIYAKDVAAYAYDWSAPQVGQLLVIYELVRQEAEKKGVKVTDAEVTAKENEQLKQVPGYTTDPQKAMESLRQRGITMSRVAMATRIQLLVEKIVTIDFKATDFVRVATLVIRPKSQSPDDMKTAQTAADAAYQELKKGTKWADASTKYSTDQNASANHGELGWVPISTLPAATQTEIKTLKIGDFTKPAQTVNGVQIFDVEALGGTASKDDIDKMKDSYTRTAGSTLVQRLQKDGKVVTTY